MTKFFGVLLAAALLFWMATALFSGAADAASGTGTPGTAPGSADAISSAPGAVSKEAPGGEHSGEGGGSAAPRLSRSGVRLHIFKDGEMDFQLLRSFGADFYGGGTPGEILLAAEDIADGDPASWQASFATLGARLEADGESRLAKGNRISARDSFFRAASYYRAAEYYGDQLDEATRALGMSCRETFLKALKLSGWYVEDLRIPFGDGFLPGYFIRSGAPGERRRTLLAQSGFDGTAEEMFFAAGRAALERGYNVLLFEGPGQAGLRRFVPGSTFVPDLGPVGRTLLDTVRARSDVDGTQVILYGASFGGYFALSAALGEPRLAAVIANSPLLDMNAYAVATMGEQVAAQFEANDLSVEDLKALPPEAMPPKYRLSLLNLCLRFGEPSVKTMLHRLKDFHISPEQLATLSMPALGMVSAGEGAIPLEQSRAFAAAAPKATLHVFERESGANAHCQLDNPPLSAAVLFDWLDEQLR
ncbi:alpha/beta hydrolase-fold protein [Aminiphilus sp.]|uniref:alpha/beta hydrolase n=1 Tax=Aminiphilus sp. TaxID=1872488 RepID=UPI00260433A0|nr:alpha/beta hydrolase-fold protein [Aminiphilus sp.]